MVRSEVRVTGRGSSRRGPSACLVEHRLAARSDLAGFSWTRGCGRCPMRVQESLSESREVSAHLGNWEIPVKTIVAWMARE
jgi:hypothetical protein